MVSLKGEPLVARLAEYSRKVVFPGTMIGFFVYSPPDFIYSLLKKYKSLKKDKSPN